MPAEINTHAHSSLYVRVTRGKVRNKTRRERKKKGKICQYHLCCTCIHLQCLHIFGCKYVYKKSYCPSQKLTLKPVNNPFTKFINVKKGRVSTPAHTDGKKQKVSAISLSTKYNSNGVEIIVGSEQILAN